MHPGPHRLLQRQLKRYVGELSAIPPEWQKFIEAVNDAYHQADDDRHRIERTLELSSQELLQANTSLQQTLQSVEQQVNDRTAELTQTLDQLKHAQIQLVQAEKMSSLGQVAAGIAHEINNPVTFIHGNLRYLNEYSIVLLELVKQYQQAYPEVPPNAQAILADWDLAFIGQDMPKILDSITTGTERITTIVQELRTFSRLDEAEVKMIPFSESIESTILILSLRLQQTCSSMIEIHQEHEVTHEIECYAAQINQVLINLMTNAIDALAESHKFADDDITPQLRTIPENNLLLDERDYLQHQTSPRIWILSRMIDATTIEVRIIDNGIGIPPAIQTKLFDPFFTTKPVGKGTGMGLSMSHQIITNLHHGKLECRSIEGWGTVFAMQIPLRQFSPHLAQSNATCPGK
jgi:two-component system, NtrC family, sensor kinase